jgi:hypothetical protein
VHIALAGGIVVSARGALGVAVELLVGCLLANGTYMCHSHCARCACCGQVGGITAAAACAFSSSGHGWDLTDSVKCGTDTGSALCARTMFKFTGLPARSDSSGRCNSGSSSSSSHGLKVVSPTCVQCNMVHQQAELGLDVSELTSASSCCSDRQEDVLEGAFSS